MVERNMCNAVMRGIAVPPGSKSTSRAKGSRRNDPQVRKRLSPKFYQLRRNQRSLPSSASVPVTFVLDSVVYWRSSLGMEAWIKQVPTQVISAPPHPGLLTAARAAPIHIAPCRCIRVHCRRAL
jgi:hypothetical protein